MADFKKRVFVVRDEASYFSETLGFSLLSLLVNPVGWVDFGKFTQDKWR